MQKENNLWQKSYKCNCHGEMIMMGYENNEKDGIPTIDLAFFSYGHCNGTLSFKSKIKWIWHILVTGQPFLDEVMLDQETAKRLGEDLIEFSKKKYINVSIIRSSSSSSSSSTSTLSAEELRIKCDKEIEELRKNCIHPTSTICEEQWAPGHLTGKKVKVCNICEKVI